MNKPRSGASHSSFCATFLCTIRVNSFQQVRFLLAVFYSWEALCTIKHQRYWRSGRICGTTEVTRYYLYCFKLLGDLGVALLLSFNSQRTWLLLIYKMCCSVVMSVSEHKTKVQAESQLQVTRWCSHRAWTASASLGRNQLPQSDLNSRDSSVLNRLTGSGLTRNAKWLHVEAFLTGEGLSDTYIWHPMAKRPCHIFIKLFCLHLDINGCGNKKVEKNKRKGKWSNVLIAWHLK